MNLAAIVFAAASATASVHLPVSTSDPHAQAAFDRGLFLYYAYNGEASARSFAQSAALDPRLAMAYWGTALADGPDLNTPLTEDRFGLAAHAIQKAASLDGALPERERRFIAIMALRYRGTFANWASDDAVFRGAMLDFAMSSDDEDARLIAAEALLEHGRLVWQQGTLAAPESQTALQLVSDVLRDDPSSLMANHLCIHLYDLAPDRTPALPCAQRLDATDFPPEAEHLAHMAAHYWVETGDYAAALRSSERAYSLLSRLTAGDPGSEHAQQYTKHDVAVGYSAAMMLGNYATAQRWSQRMSAAFGTSFDALTALRFGHYETAYAADGDEFAGTSVRGLAAVQSSRIAEAHALAARLPSANAMPGYLPQLFLARLAEAEGRYADAARWVEKSLTNQRAAFGGEMIPAVPAGEALGDLYLRLGNAGGAVAAFDDELASYPNDPRALFGLAQALAASGQSTQAATVRARFEKEWEGAATNVREALP